MKYGIKALARARLNGRLSSPFSWKEEEILMTHLLAMEMNEAVEEYLPLSLPEGVVSIWVHCHHWGDWQKIPHKQEGENLLYDLKRAPNGVCLVIDGSKFIVIQKLNDNEWSRVIIDYDVESVLPDRRHKANYRKSQKEEKVRALKYLLEAHLGLDVEYEDGLLKDYDDVIEDVIELRTELEKLILRLPDREMEKLDQHLKDYFLNDFWEGEKFKVEGIRSPHKKDLVREIETSIHALTSELRKIPDLERAIVLSMMSWSASKYMTWWVYTPMMEMMNPLEYPPLVRRVLSSKRAQKLKDLLWEVAVGAYQEDYQGITEYYKNRIQGREKQTLDSMVFEIIEYTRLMPDDLATWIVYWSLKSYRKE